MLSQQEADLLLEMLKKLKGTDSPIQFPGSGEYRSLDLTSEDGRHSFIVDVNRKGYINFSKRYTYQSRYRKDTILLRLDINGPEHRNPDGTLLPGNHFHVYQEGYGDKIAIEVPSEIINPDDMYQTLIDFLVYFKTINTDELNMQTVIL